jgi:hypothetical protein
MIRDLWSVACAIRLSSMRNRQTKPIADFGSAIGFVPERERFGTYVMIFRQSLAL